MAVGEAAASTHYGAVLRVRLALIVAGGVTVWAQRHVPVPGRAAMAVLVVTAIGILVLGVQLGDAGHQ